MLKDQQVAAVLPAQDLNRARAFYSEKLGLDPDNPEAEDNLQYTCGGGTGFLVYQTPNAGTAKNTQIGWMVSDVAATVAELRDKGVVFEDYDFPGLKTENGIATMPDGSAAAWFLDSEGNILSINQTG
ncbi:VOC family protein [Arthrobacter sp. TES]|jgi:predicted enzyme related to lactoylglutathione lyase|uniref:VOC family protein n=1 Tax=Paenarthrobacter ureafaciens TaxID=37931 RepID=A0AAX3EN94_PAEUR|nr:MULTISPECIES: VOC family protein [Paenarthrobacter]AMB40119.1 glyoxalase [Arthrobacter sp. ATCC 21022]AOY71754.1 glyoxalase [Arthrobacter sp. ZXY-2]ERI36989.1 glyoxalase [Arthrobacter sp. AK-YN10]NKR12902.1 glyoxalase [Arthrobacter sp. M5]NKR15362.1 glyoxalase [Arthrobacter sp. M6]OEH59555.1 glyoxalase [Arthrobacter sp. D2]OEH60644.1 glyoxalase [Arthrobacter sp. D4]QOI63555.1 VOC family protein [Arthrobacter sp. TES]BCW83886.1 glyoxalase [Arthrobacter sp. NicSoilE8]